MSKPEPHMPSWGDDMFRFAKRRRQPRWVRVLIAILVVCCIYLIGVNAISPSSSTNPSNFLPSRVTSKATPPSAEELGLTSRKGAAAHQEPLVAEERTGTRRKSRVEREREKERERERQEERRERDQEPLEPKRPAVDIADEDEDGGERNAQMQKLESDLKHIFLITPDELHVRELLRPIENSGKERLREIGLRARAFRTLFEAWEEVHLVNTQNTTMVRDDVIHYLRRAKDLRGIDTHKPRAEIIRSYESFRYFLTKLSALLFPWTAPYFADHMTLHASIRHGGRGIVLSGGDGQLTYLLTSARAIRKLGCNLPIEVMYLGEDDLGDDSRSELEALPGVITRDMKQMVHDEGWDLKGWAGKPFAILLSSFREVIFIDADAQFFKTPEVLFEDEAYEETGALFFRDRLMFPESKRKWLQQILPKPMSRRVRQSRFWTGESGHMQESGVVVVDKWRHFMALLMVTRMNGPDRDGDKDKGIVGTYDMVYGDKETFWLGWELVGDSDYAFHPGDAGNMGVAKPKSEKDEEDREKEKKEKDEADKKSEEEEEGRKAEERAKKEREEKEAAEKEKERKRKEEETKAAAPPPAEVDADKAAEQKKADESAKVADKEEKKEPSKEVVPPLDDDINIAKKLRKRAATPRRTSDSQTGDDDEMDDGVDDELEPLDAPRTNYSICAPQLLHLGRDGRPLWFNGWILDNKFDADHAQLSTFDVYMKERRKGSKVADWRLESNNMCCLENDRLYEFTQQERNVIQNIFTIATEQGVLNKSP